MRRRKRLTRKPRRWKPCVKNKKMKDVKEKPRIKKHLKLSKPKSKRNWTWTWLPNTSKGSGTGSKPKVSSLQRREREERKERRERKSETVTQEYENIVLPLKYNILALSFYIL